MPYSKVSSSNTWDWDAVPEMEGTLVGQERKKGQNEREYTIFSIEELTSKEIFKVWGATLEEKLARVENGTRVKITFEGVARGQGGNKYKLFEIEKWTD